MGRHLLVWQRPGTCGETDLRGFDGQGCHRLPAPAREARLTCDRCSTLTFWSQQSRPRAGHRVLCSKYALRGQIELVGSRVLLEELEGCLVEVFKFDAAAAAATRNAVASLGELVEPIDAPRVCRDPDDDHVLAAAVVM
ncbi:MAG TPA: PIN domain-containing protein [Chloroflexota bacterium]